jgi:hypothetical protein
MKEKAAKKEQELLRIKTQNQLMAEQKRKTFESKVAEEEEKKRQKIEEEKQKLNDKKIREGMREDHRKFVVMQTQANDEARKQMVLSDLDAAKEMVEKTKKKNVDKKEKKKQIKKIKEVFYLRCKISE